MTGLCQPRDLRRPVARLRAAADPPEPAPPAPRLRVGLLGGSFNPAHDGHRYVSLEAMKRLRLDQVWWLVSPQNPLKAAAGMAPLAERLAGAAAVARHPRLQGAGAGDPARHALHRRHAAPARRAGPATASSG